MDSNWEYERLDLSTNSIRLVQILKGDSDQPIECVLFESLLDPDEGIPYEALSYVWGTQASADRIWVNGRPFQVTENLLQALLALRQPDHDRVLWVDAICIDQNHAAERGHQVRQMNHVYQTAENVIIWLGTSNIQIDHLFCWMRRLDQDILALSTPHTQLGPETWAHHWRLLLWRFKEAASPDGIVNALNEILRRAWFSRVWVIQEAALAKSATVTSGRNSVNSRAFVAMPTVLGIKCSENVQSRLEVIPGPLRSGEDFSWWEGPFSQDLDILLRKFGESQATDPRDIIYALLGLSADASTSDILRPDYELSLEETVQQTVLFLLHQRNYLQEFRVPADLPVWDIQQLLVALEDLPQHVFTWAVDQRKNTLITNFLSCWKGVRKLQFMDDFIDDTASYKHWALAKMTSIFSSPLDFMLQWKELYELYVVTSDSSGSWPLPAIIVNRGGTALGPVLPQSNGAGLNFGHLNKKSVIIGINKKRGVGTLEVILNLPDYYRLSVVPHYASPATAATRGTQAFVALLGQRNKVHTWKWCEGKWFHSEGATVTQSILAEILSDVDNALYMRASKGQTESLSGYLDERPGIENMRCRQFRTPLGYAAESNNATTATLLLDRGADIESKDWKKPFATPLWIAASQGHIETVKVLVSRGANIEVLAGENDGPCTPLWIAASKGFEEVVLFLASMGANINVSAWGSDRMRTAVGIAASNFHLGVLQVLAERGAEMGESDKEVRGQMPSRTS